MSGAGDSIFVLSEAISMLFGVICTEVHTASNVTQRGLVTLLLKKKQHSGSLSVHTHTHCRHKTDTSVSKEQKEDRVICLASVSASILIAANSNSSCQMVLSNPQKKMY